MLRRFVLATAVALAVGLLPAAALAHPRQRSLNLPVFRVDGTHDFKVDVWAIRDGEHHTPRVVVSIWKHNSQTTYSVPGQVGPGGFSASFRRFGWVNVRYRTGPPAIVKDCHGRSVKEPGGRFTGVFEFHGDYHFTVVNYPSLNVRALSPFAGVCVGGSTGGAKGVHLEAFSWGGAAEAFQNHEGGPVRFIARAGEEFGSLQIQRYVEVFGPAKDFAWSRNLKSAHVTPPAPFRGSASFSFSRRRDNWRGNLTVDFPGFHYFPLTWSPTAAFLEPGSCKIHAPHRPQPPFPCE